MVDIIPFADLVGRLRRKGHNVVACEGHGRAGPALSVGPDRIITVAVEEDPVLKEPYRQRYFVCDGARLAALTGLPEEIRGRWLGLVSRMSGGWERAFLAGPGAWLLSRVVSSDRVLTWVRDGEHSWYQATVEAFCSKVGVEGETRTVLDLIGQKRRSAAVILDPRADWFLAAVAVSLSMTSETCVDCFMADGSCEAVYKIHHHDKIVASIPNAGLRAGAVWDLISNPDFFVDVSDY